MHRLRRLSGRRGARQDEDRFVIEGPTLLGEALAAGLELELVLAAEEGEEREEVAQARARGIPVVAATAAVLAAASSTVTPRAVLAVGLRRVAPPEALDDARFAVVCVDVADPGNLGTLLRTAHAAGADAVVVPPGAVDPFNPKVVRAAAGALFRLPVVVDLDPVGALTRLGVAGVRRVAAVARGGHAPEEVALRGATALVLGGEAAGLPPGVLAAVDEHVTIPMRPGAESLNVAVAGAVLCFEVARQRRAPGP